MRPRLRAAGAAVAVLALLVPLAIGPVAGANHVCEDRRVYRYCGEHPWGAGMPLRLVVSSADASGSRSAELLRAVGDGVGAWNQAWIAARAANGGGPRPNACGATGPLLCIAGVTTAPGIAGDGTSTVGFRQGLTGTCGAGLGYLAVTCFTYAERDGVGRHRIVEVDVFLDASVDMRAPRVDQLLVGEPAWTYPGPMPEQLCTPRWADLWSIVAHELGHAVGLEHIRTTFPVDLTDVHPQRQTMWDTYRWCSTHQRTLADGDVLGLIQVARDVLADTR